MKKQMKKQMKKRGCSCLIAVVCCLALLFGGCARGVDCGPVDCGPADASQVHDDRCGPGCSTVILSFRGLEELRALRETALSADEETLKDRLSRFDAAFLTREELLSGLERMESLPYLPISGGALVSIEYAPQPDYVIVTLETVKGERVELFYEPDVDPADYGKYGELLAEPFTCCDGRVTVYGEARRRELGEGGRDFLVWHTVTDGVFLRVFYYTDEPDCVMMEEVFDGLTLRRLGELT